MKFNLKTSMVILLVLWELMAVAQKASLSGKIYDKQSGETLIGATVLLQQNGNTISGIITDLDGGYFFSADVGIYDISVSYVSYSKFKVEGYELLANTANTLDVALETESVTLTEVVVSALLVRNTNVALLALQRKAYSIQDGVSSQQINQTASANAADAVRQMTGAVVEGGRFIVVRGLGDRYSISQLNGVTLPSTDPYRNSTSIDLIPSQMIENIISVKTFTPDVPGNFSGGLLNINTKSIPDNFNLSIGVTTSYNSQSSLVENFQSHPDKGKYDWLGFEDGSRDQPTLLLDPEIRNQLSSSTYLTARQPGNDEVRSIFYESSRALSNVFIPTTRSTPTNVGLSFSIGDRLSLFGKDFGYTLALNYASNFQHYDNGAEATYINTNTDFLFGYQELTESKSVQNPSVGGLFNFGYKLSGNHALSGNVIFNNDAEIVSRSQSGSFLGQVSNSLAVFNTNSLEFIQRQLASYQLGGEHIFPGLNNTEIEWNVALTNSFQKEPDLRYFAYTSVTESNGSGEEDTEYFLNNAEYAFPYHFFRELNDQGVEGKVDISIPFLSSKSPSNLIKVGGLYHTMDREFDEYRYQLNNSGVSSNLNFSTFDGDFDAFWNLDNFGIVDTTYKSDGDIQRYVTGYHYVNQINARNFYTGETKIAAGYAMLVYNLARRLKVIGGVRVETTDMSVISEDPTVPEGKLDLTDYLYSANLVYALSEQSNLRLAASKTLARPNMRELAPFVQFDTKNGFFNVGNPNLQRTLIQNYDIRYEIYPRSGELLAVSVFYKQFKDPIIRAFNPRATIPELSFINVDEAIVLGAEIEFRKKLDFISPKLSNFYFSANLALIKSSYDIPADEIANSKNIDPEYDESERPFQGQAPYIINTSLGYINIESGWESALSFNVSGERLYNISLFATPDVYEQPFPLMNFKLAKQLANNFQLSFTAKNILNAINKKTLEFHGEEYIAESYAVGTSLGIGISYSIK